MICGFFLLLLSTFSSKLSVVPLFSVCLPHTLFLLCPKNLLFYTSPTVSFLPFFLLGIRLPWTPPRLCSSWWQRRACSACLPAWARFTPATATLTASSTSPTPRRRCLERLSQQPGRPAEPGGDQMNWTQTDGGDTTQPNWGGKKDKLSRDCYCPVFFSPTLQLHVSLPHEPLRKQSKRCNRLWVIILSCSKKKYIIFLACYTSSQIKNFHICPSVTSETLSINANKPVFTML